MRWDTHLLDNIIFQGKLSRIHSFKHGAATGPSTSLLVLQGRFGVADELLLVDTVAIACRGSDASALFASLVGTSGSLLIDGGHHRVVQPLGLEAGSSLETVTVWEVV